MEHEATYNIIDTLVVFAVLQCRGKCWMSNHFDQKLTKILASQRTIEMMPLNSNM